MAASPKWKVYDAQGRYQASVHEPEAGAALLAFYGEGATLRLGHGTKDIAYINAPGNPAAESYDEVANTALAFLGQRVAALHKRLGWEAP